MSTTPIGPHYINTSRHSKTSTAEDKNPAGDFLAAIAAGAAGVAQVATPIVQNMVSQVPGIGNAGGLLSGQSLGGTGTGGGTNDQMALIEMQRKIQQETQIFTTYTNVLKSDHDAKMSAVRNMRTS